MAANQNPAHSQRTVRDGRMVFPYRNTDGEHASDIREWLDARERESLEAIRDDNSPRSRAILALAQFDAEAGGIHWDSIPWRDTDLGCGCQLWYVSGAAWRVDWLVNVGAVELPR